MNINFQMHLMQTQTEELIKYIEQLENHNAVMMQFIQDNGLGEKFAKMVEPKEEAPVPQQESSPVEVQE